MRWTKSNIHHILGAYSDLQSHMWDEFHYWWEEQHGQLLPDTPEWKEFWDGMHTLNDNSFFDFDWKTKEWIIRKGDEEYRFPENWPYENLKEEPDLEMVWHSGFWDGPLSGMALYNGQYAWFECSSDYDCDPYHGLRVYRLYKLSKEQLEEEFYWHRLFEEHVGYHTNYGATYAKHGGKSREDMDKFYEPHKKRTKRDYTDNEELGEFTSVQFRRNRPLSNDDKEGTVEAS